MRSLQEQVAKLKNTIVQLESTVTDFKVQQEQQRSELALAHEELTQLKQEKAAMTSELAEAR